MSARYFGGLVRKDPLVLNPAAGNAANGVFTMSQYMQAVKNATWPAYDPYFNETVLLLHGNGTNGAQNNTFLDSSSNNFTITRNGNTTQGTFSPFSVGAGQWSNYFDGTGDYLSFAGNSAFDFGTGDFTIEMWVYFNSYQSSNGFLVGQNFFSSSFQFDSTGKLQFYSQPASAYVVTGSTALPTNQWAHVALTRSGTTFRVFLNGVVDGTGTNSSSAGFSSANQLRIAAWDTLTATWVGYISNLRIVKGTAVYTSAFTPSTAPLTAITNTSLLTCQSNRFVDNSTNAFAITRNGDVRVTPFSPFAPSAAYSASTNGGSGYFDGTGDYLSIADAAGLRFGTGNFTIQAWIYRSAAGAVHSIAAKGGASTGWVFQVHSDNKLRFTQTTTNIDSTGTIPAGAWTHVAVVREGTGTNQTKLYINGVNDGQATVTTDFNQTEQLNIGADRGNANPMNGYIAGFKYVVGTAETITVPTAPPTGGTALLNFTNAGIFDNTGKNNLETVGNAQIDTTTKKFGTGSMEFDGTGDYLLGLMNPDMVFGTGDMTIECWVNPNTVSGTDTIFDTRTSGAYGTNSFTLQLESGVVKAYAGSASGELILAGTTAVSTGTWTHIAFTRASGTNRIFVGGSQQSSNTTSWNQTFTSTNTFYIGQTIGLDRPFDGFIDDLRITKGVARYTANFTAQTSQWQDQ